MKLIDLHCDTNLKLFEAQSKALLTNEFQIDLTRLRAVSSYVQFFASWFELGAVESPFKHSLDMVRYLKDLLVPYTDFDVLQSASQLATDNHHILLSIEEGGCMEGSLDKLSVLYQEGVRSITLTWNYENELGYTNLDTDNRGLKTFGFEAIEAMNHLGMIIDLSHLSDKGTTEAIVHSKKPVVATHSNARALTQHTRNLPDDLIKGIAHTGGIVGLNFWSELLGASRKSQIDDMIRHIEYNIKVGGEGCIAIGTDFDGINCEVEIPHIGRIDDLAVALNRRGRSDAIIEKLFYKNAERVIRDVL